MQLDTITELLQIPGFKVTHMMTCTENRIEFLLEREEESASICSVCGYSIHAFILPKPFFVFLENHKSIFLNSGMVALNLLLCFVLPNSLYK